jgi:hypothetical protein
MPESHDKIRAATATVRPKMARSDRIVFRVIVPLFETEDEFSNGRIARRHPISAMPVAGGCNMLRGRRCGIIERIGVDIVYLEVRTVIEAIGWRPGNASDSQID